MRTASGLAAVLGGLLLTLGCAAVTEPGPAADVRGTWNFTGTQLSPSLSLDGVLLITAQSGQEIAGTATWDESGTVGGVVVQGGALVGRAIGDSDVDFDVTLAAGARRFVGRVSADTIEGVWVQLSAGTSGEFRAIRGVSP